MHHHVIVMAPKFDGRPTNYQCTNAHPCNDTLVFNTPKLEEILTYFGFKSWLVWIDEFLNKIDEDLVTFDGTVSELEKALKRLPDGEREKTPSKIYQQQDESFRRRFEEMWLEEMRMEMGRKYVDKEEKKSKSKSTEVKLPKLVTSKFEGTALDWIRFCNYFETVIDKQDISPVTEFSYLKEFYCS